MDLVDPVLYLDEALVIGLTELVVFRGMAPSIFPFLFKTVFLHDAYY